MICVKYNWRYNFSTRSLEHLRLADVCKTEPYYAVKLVTKREQHATETLIENYLVKEKSFYCLIERSVSNITGVSIITQVIIEILALSVAENGIIFRYNHLP